MSPVGLHPRARLGVGIAKPARFPSEETRSDSAFALLSLGSRNHARSGFDGLSHPNSSPVPQGTKRSFRPWLQSHAAQKIYRV